MVLSQLNVFKRGHLLEKGLHAVQIAKKVSSIARRMMTIYCSFTFTKPSVWKWKSRLLQIFHVIILVIPQSKDLERQVSTEVNDKGRGSCSPLCTSYKGTSPGKGESHHTWAVQCPSRCQTPLFPSIWFTRGLTALKNTRNLSPSRVNIKPGLGVN